MPRKTAVNDAQLIESIKELYGTEVTSGDLKGFCASRSLNYQTVTRRLEQYKTSRGRWNLEVTQEKVEEIERSFHSVAVLPEHQQNLIPAKDDTFVKFGNFNDIKKIIQSRLFYPTFITGLSGNGKTFSVEQACAQLNRELIRVNITIETDEDDLIGGFRLVNVKLLGTTVPSSKHLNEVLCYSWTKSTSPATKSFVCNPSLRVKGSS